MQLQTTEEKFKMISGIVDNINNILQNQSKVNRTQADINDKILDQLIDLVSRVQALELKGEQQ